MRKSQTLDRFTRFDLFGNLFDVLFNLLLFDLLLLLLLLLLVDLLLDVALFLLLLLLLFELFLFNTCLKLDMFVVFGFVFVLPLLYPSPLFRVFEFRELY